MDFRDRQIVNNALERVCNLLAELEDVPGTAAERYDELRHIHRAAVVLTTRTNEVMARAGLAGIEPPIVNFDETSHHEARLTLRDFLRRRRVELDGLSSR